MCSTFLCQSNLQQASWASLPFTWVAHQLPYFGVQLTASGHWLSQINAMKMSILPKLLYPFRVLPISLPSCFLCLTQRRIMSYIWGTTKPCIPKSTFYLSKLCSGLGIPNFSSYYYAAQLAQLPKYHAAVETPLWVAIESIDCDPIYVANMLWLQPNDRAHLSNPITKHSLTIWDKFRGTCNLQPLLTTPYTPSSETQPFTLLGNAL